jgi:hypothetical protein
MIKLKPAVSGLFIFVMPILGITAFAWGDAGSLAEWTDTSQPAIQQKILNRIFPNAVGSVNDGVPDPVNGQYYFPKGGNWVRLGKDVVYNVKPMPYLAVTCILYHKLAGEPINSTTYLFTSPTEKPEPISGGYSAQENVQSITLPKLNKTFLVLTMTSPDGVKATQWSASVIDVIQGGRIKTAWMSPNSIRNFQFGFAELGGRAEDLVVRSTSRSGETSFSAYRWNGQRFELDDMAFESGLKALSDDVWRFGAGR